MYESAILLQYLPTERQHLRIAVVTETYPPEINGVAMTLGRVVGAMQRRNHQIQLIRPRQSSHELPAQQENFEEVLQRGFPIPRYEGLKMGLPAKAALLALWTRKRPDVVHIATEGPLGWSALSAANKLRIPVATDFHTNFHSYSRHYGLSWLRKPIIAYLRKFHNKALCTMVPTEGIRQELLCSGYENLIVVARGVDTELFSPHKRSMELRGQWGVGTHDLAVLYVGRLAPEKNLSLLVSAFAEMQQRHPGARLVLVGDGPERAMLQAQCPQAIFAGMRTGEELAAHYASADVFLFPSTTETYGNVTVEAMASGNAVIAYDYAAAAEHIRHGENGLLAKLENSHEFMAHTARLGSTPDLARRLGAAARNSVVNLEWNHIYSRFEEVLLEISRHEQDDDFYVV